jgi:N-acetylneuraminic acid mutarotase
MRDAYRYNTQRDEWQRLPDLPSPGYAWAGCAVDENHIMLTGRADGKIHKDIWLIDVRDMIVQQIGELVVQATTAPLVRVKEHEFWLIAGEPDSNKNRTNKITKIRLVR